MRFEPIEIAIKRLPNGAGLDLPGYATDGAAGMDVCAAEFLFRFHFAHGAFDQSWAAAP